jgi:hypothetical protein
MCTRGTLFCYYKTQVRKNGGHSSAAAAPSCSSAIEQR